MACRAFAVLLLITGVGFGIHLGMTPDEEVQDPRLAAEKDLRAADAQQQTTRDWHRDYAKSAADDDAEAKAENIAQVASDQAKALDNTYADIVAEEEARNSTPDLGPIPEDCDAYSGNKAAGCARLLDHGFGLDQMPCLESLWDKESGWNHLAHNPGSGAYGIPQALPGEKMASVGDDWQTNPNTQIIWGLSYISGRYGTPCDAWAYSEANGFY